MEITTSSRVVNMRPILGKTGPAGGEGPEGPVGPSGPAGERGLPGVNAVPTDEAIGTYATTPGTSTNVGVMSVASRIAHPLDVVVQVLDMRDPSPLAIVAVGDSTTSPYPTGGLEKAWQQIAATHFPDRPFRCRTWSKNNNAYPASPVIWQDAATVSDPGGIEENALIAADSFSAEGEEIVGRLPDVGAGAWGGTGTGAYIAQAGAAVANPTYAGGGIPGIQVNALARDGKDFVYTGEWRISSQDTSGLQRRLRAGITGTTEIRVQAAGGTTVTVTVSKVINGTATTLGTFPAGVVPSNQPPSWYPFSIALDGLNLTLTLNGQTVSYTLTQPDVDALGNGFGMADNSVHRGVRAFEVRGAVVRPPVIGTPSPLGWATVYNASVAGSTIDYQQARLAAMLPEQPDVLWIHHGHNYDEGSPAAFLAALDGFVTATFDLWDPCPVVVSSQNPEVPGSLTDDAQIAAHRARQVALRAHAISRGWGYVPVYEAFVARSDGGAALIQPDGVHPLVGAGTALQAEVFEAYVVAQSRRPMPA